MAVAGNLAFSDIYTRILKYTWDSTNRYGNTTQAKEYGNDGYGMALLGLDPRTNRAHQWSFLQPHTTLSLGASAMGATLPADFAGMVDDFTFPVHKPYGQIEQRTPEVIYALRSGTGGTSTSKGRLGAPRYYAIEPLGYTTTGQTWRAIFYPAANEAYTLNYRYRVMQDGMTADTDHPAGGAQFAPVILQAGLAIAEQRELHTQGHHTKLYETMMTAAIDQDLIYAPRNVGYNRDASDLRGLDYSRRTGVSY